MTQASSLPGRRVLVTSADTFMGPAVVEALHGAGAEVIADVDPLIDPAAPGQLVGRCGHLDAVVANLDVPAYGARVAEIDDEQWLAGFDAMVHPLMRLTRAVVPQMIERGHGSIVVLGSSSPLRRMTPQAISYVAARSAQLAFVRSAGHELAQHNVRLNAIAQNFVANDTYYPPEVLAHPKFKERLQRDVPAQRIGRPEESAELALFLLSDASSFMFGQVISNDGGWS